MDALFEAIQRGDVGACQKLIDADANLAAARNGAILQQVRRL